MATDKNENASSATKPEQESEISWKQAETPSDFTEAEIENNESKNSEEESGSGWLIELLKKLGVSDTVVEWMKTAKFGEKGWLKDLHILYYAELGKGYLNGASNGAVLFSGFDKLVDDDSRNDLQGFEDLLKGIIGIYGINVPGFDMAFGGKEMIQAFEEILKGESLVTNCFKFVKGMLRYAKGFCKDSVVGAPLAIPLGLLETTFSLAIEFFEKGEYFQGIMTLIIGASITTGLSILIKGTLKVAFKALMELVRIAFNSTASPLLATPFTAVAGLAIIALISALITAAISKLLSAAFAQGGFPEKGQPFIAREAGPELVGTIRGRNAVVNNNQIVEAVSNGVSHAVSSAIGGELTGGPVHARLCIDGKQVSIA